MNNYSLHFSRFKDKKPEHGAQIFLIRSSAWYNTIEPSFATVEYVWVVVDETGPTGDEIIYEQSEETPEDCVLRYYLVPQIDFSQTDLWCYAEDVDQLVSDAEEHNDLDNKSEKSDECI